MGCPTLEILLTTTRSSEVQGQDKKSREENKKGLHKEETSHRSIVGLSKFDLNLCLQRSIEVCTPFNIWSFRIHQIDQRIRTIISMNLWCYDLMKIQQEFANWQYRNWLGTDSSIAFGLGHNAHVYVGRSMFLLRRSSLAFSHYLRATKRTLWAYFDSMNTKAI
jgi:hypothetical protein